MKTVPAGPANHRGWSLDAESHDIPVMALHIRDFRQSDAAGLCRLRKTARLMGTPPLAGPGRRILVGLQDDRLAAAAWIVLEGDTGLVPAILAGDGAGWPSKVRELVAEASLWLISRGAARIELPFIPDDEGLRDGLLEMGFRADASAGVMCRLVPARSAA